MPTKHLIFTLFVLFYLSLSSAVNASSTFNCVIEPTQTVDIKSPIVGTLRDVTVQRGDSVKKGQVLARLESSAEIATTELALHKANMTAPIMTAENKIIFAKKKVLRRQDMYAEKFISEQELDEAEGELKLAESELKMAYENKELAILEWQYQDSLLALRTIYSPLNGVVVEQNVYPGEVVEPSGQKQNILKLAQLDPLRIYVILPMNAFGKVKMGMKVNINPEIPLGSQYQGQVNIIDRIVDAASGTLGVFVKIPNSDLTIPAGVKCTAEFPFKLDETY